jgi:hypothetical protein
MATVRVKVTKDMVNKTLRSLTDLVQQQVLVGIPDSTTSRKQEVGQPITNATLGFIHEFGSPAANIPARPFLIPGVRKSQKKYLPELAAACDSALDDNLHDALKHMAAAGIIAESSAKHEIHTAHFVPLKPSTVANRFKSRQTKSQRKGEKQYFDMLLGGADPYTAQQAAGIQPLINTGQLARAITSVVRKAK